MPLYPPFNFPFYLNNHNYPRKNNSPNNFSISNFDNNYYTQSQKSTNGINPKNIVEEKENRKKASENAEDSEAFFEIFGLKLYFDDILIMCILFFLYTEKVHDDELFICLILLLLT